jgi:hypothetical protein
MYKHYHEYLVCGNKEYFVYFNIIEMHNLTEKANKLLNLIIGDYL